jgi:hypothetical protein
MASIGTGIRLCSDVCTFTPKCNLFRVIRSVLSSVHMLAAAPHPRPVDIAHLSQQPLPTSMHQHSTPQGR